MSSFNSMFKGLREYWTPVLSVSKFETDAVLTPEEFVAAGDYLVFKCSTWSWESGDVAKRRDYLPPDKQFLVTRGAPCFKSAQALELVAVDRQDTTIDGDWFTTTTSAAAEASADSDVDMLEDFTSVAAASGTTAAPSTLTATSTSKSKKNPKKSKSFASATTSFVSSGTNHASTLSSTTRPPLVASPEHGLPPGGPASQIISDDIPDMDDLVGNVTEDAIPVRGLSQRSANSDIPTSAPISSINATGPTANNSAQRIMRTRTYDLSISYDKFYQTPRLSLVGYDEARRPLPPSTALQDISSDHANKTVTLEAHPHLNMQVASIHPCRHAEVMKKLISSLRSSGKTVRADQYLVLFLKFMSSVLPTIDYAHTITLE